MIIGGKRNCGKSTELVKISAVNQIPIIVSNGERGKCLEELAIRTGYKIPKPISFYNRDQFLDPRINEILIDDIEDLLFHLFHCRTIAISTSMPLNPMHRR